MNYMDLSNWAKALLISIFLFAGAAANAQRLKANNGKIAFTSDAPLELIEASSQVVGCALNPQTREFAFTVPMASFKPFNSALQRQHFNENYVESDKFPNGSFSGKIIEEVDLTVPGTYTVRAKGKLLVHGVPVERIIRATVVVTGKQAAIKARFDVPLEDHKITIPRIVNRKIAEVIDVKFEATLKQ